MDASILNHPVVLLNTSSGIANKGEVGGQLTDILHAYGTNPKIITVDQDQDIIGITRKAVDNGATLIVAGGGDGTISGIASVLVDTNCVLGILPFGTFNHFAKDLNIPLEVESAAQVLRQGTIKAVDVAEVNGRIFLNISGLGVHPRIVRQREKLREHVRGRMGMAFLWGIYNTLRRHPFMTVRLHTDEQTLSRKTPFVFIANNEHQLEGLDMAARPQLDAGYLCVYTAHRPGRLGILKFGFRALLGHLKDSEDFDVLRTTEVFIEARHKHLPVTTDGELSLLQTPLHYLIRPKALQVLVPNEDSSAI